MGCKINFFLIFSLVIQAECQQEFSKQPQYTEVNPGQNAHLTCIVSNKKGECGWQKDGKRQGLIGGQKYVWNGNQERGDCSLLVLNATLEWDDGMWQCQVTTSSLESQDALTSTPVRLLVRVPPQSPQIKYQNKIVTSENNVTVVAQRNVSVHCISRFGNPPGFLRWYLGSDDVTEYSYQKNSSEAADNNKLWKAESTLQLTYTKEQNGLPLKCVAYHEAYERKSLEIQVALNVQYVPVVVLRGLPNQDVEDGKDSVTLECQIDANPPAVVLWKKDGRELLEKDLITLNPVKKEDAGLYSCEGRNNIGSSELATVHLDVKFPPLNVRVVPQSTQAKVHNQTSLMCMADGNPPPRFIWLFSSTGDPATARIKGVDATLNIYNVTYDAQGTYVCMASNSVKGEEKSAQSDEVELNVFGEPQIHLSAMSTNLVQAEQGEDAVLEIPFCSDPPPTAITWEWDRLRLSVGEGRGKYIAEQITAAQNPSDCYDARLVIQKVESSDARRYMLTVENDRGSDSFAMALDVSEPVSMSAVIGIVIGCLVVLVLFVLFLLYAFRAEKWCFQKDIDFKSNKADGDLEEIRSRHLPMLSSRPGAIPPDALYTLPPKRLPESPTESNHFASDQNDHNENKNTARDIDYTEVEVPKMESRSNNSLVTKTDFPDYRPQPHEIADI